jgi:exodeoxyribonuclease-3
MAACPRPPARSLEIGQENGLIRIATLNVNGIRSAQSKGLLPWIKRTGADVLCLQEVKAHEADIPEPLRAIDGLHAHFHCAQKKGYAGTALYSTRKPRRVRHGFGVPEFDDEGRYVEADFGGVTVVSVYFPSGAAGSHRQASKDRFLAAFLPHLAGLRARCTAEGREVVFCGDVNIAHKEIDLKNWRSNQKNSGFLPHERNWLTELFDTHGWVDVFRRLDSRPEQYTWWSNRGASWEKNVGWRLDYQIATPGLAAKAKAASIYLNKRFSDHAPLVIDYSGRL